MALYFNLPVHKDSYDLLLTCFQCCSKLPKEYKYTLGEQLKNDCTDVLVNIFEVTKKKEQQKLIHIENALQYLEKCQL